MITEEQKREIDKKYFPNGFFYVVPNFDEAKKSRRLNAQFDSLKLYEENVKNLLYSNGLYFYKHLVNLPQSEFITEINNQYLNYTLENEEHAKLWLSLTYDLVLKGLELSQIEDITSKGQFIEWHKQKVSELKNEKPIIEKTVFDFIHNVTSKERFLNDLKVSFKTEIGQSIRVIINTLKNAEIIVIPERQFKTFYNLLEISFNRSIGTYASINDAKEILPIVSDPIIKILNPLIIKHKAK